MQALDGRPYRLTRGQNGARAQLATVAELIRPDLNPQAATKRPRTKEIPTNVQVNVMAPPAKQSRKVWYIFILTLSIATNARIFSGKSY